ncbi:MAG TPA: TerC family protein [Xanthomonadales bacterium]|nr:TerC family protein [Xanthomonadales bacterium]
MFSTEIWVALLTLTTLEIVLGVDNLVFISIAVSRLPAERRSAARRFGLALACISRILLLLTLAYLAQMEYALFTLWGNPMSIRDLVLIGGGLFLLIKGTMEIHESVEGSEEDQHERPASATFGMVIAQIAVIDIVFSLDSVITAVGMVDNRWVMVAAILIAVIVMLIASDPIGEFIDRHPTIKMLALSFLILVGVALIADGFEFHIPRAYLYFAMAFSAGVEALNMLARRRGKKKAQRRAERERIEREI